ncbi:unnamed protein product [Caretta caretta]
MGERQVSTHRREDTAEMVQFFVKGLPILALKGGSVAYLLTVNTLQSQHPDEKNGISAHFALSYPSRWLVDADRHHCIVNICKGFLSQS